MKIDKNKVVSLHYTLKEGSEDGLKIEETYGGIPLTFIFGIGQMIPGFEKKLLGKSEGDQYAFLLAPGEAYGDTKHDSVVEVPIQNFRGPDGKLDTEAIKVGKPIRMKNQNGQSFQGIIKEATLTTVKVDFNHPMAGKSLHFNGEIIKVREATTEEIVTGVVSNPM